MNSKDKSKDELLQELEILKKEHDALKSLLEKEINELKITETQNKMLKHSLDIFTDGIYWLDSNNTFVYVNEAGGKAFGCNPEELIDKSLYDVNPTTTPESLDDLWRQLRTHGSYINETVHRKLDGSEFHVEVRTVYVQFEGKEYYNGFARDITERKLAEAVLRESEERFQLLFNKAPLGYQSLDFNGNFIEVNQQWLDTLGYTREEVIGKWFGDFLSPIYKDKFKDRFPIFKDKGSIHSEFEMIHKNGSKLFIAFDGRIGYNLTGEFIQTHCILQDITERKISENALMESEEKYRRVVENIHEAIIIEDVEANLVFANEEYCRMFGFSNDDLQFLKLQDYVAPEWHEEVITRHNNRMKGMKVAEEFIYEGLRKDGLKIWIEARVTLLTEKDKIVGTLSFERDITLRKKTEDALHESEEKYHALIENALEGILILSLDGTILFANKSVSRTFEIPDVNYLIGKNAYDFLTTESVKKAQDDFENLENGIDSYIAQYYCKTFTGKEICVESIGKRIIYEGLDADIISLHNITERKQAEAEIKRIGKHYQALIEKAPDGIVLLNANGNFKFVSPSAKNMFGFSIDDEIINTNPAEFTHPDDLPLVLSELTILIQNPSYTPTIQYRFADKSGQWKWVESTFSNMLSDPSVESIVINFRNITERKIAEQALKESEEKFRNLVWDMQVGVLIQDHKAEILLSNPKALELLDLTEDQLLGKTSFDPDWNVIHEDGSNFPGPEHPVPQAIATRKSIRNVVMGVSRPSKGDRVWLLVDAEPHLKPNGNIHQVVCTFIDITLRKIAEEALRASEERLQLTLEVTNIGIWDWDLKNDVWYGSPIYYNMLGYDPDYGLGDRMVWLERVHPEERDHVAKAIKNVLNGESHDYSYEARMKHSDGTYRWINVVGNAIEWDNENKPIRFIGVRIDITQRKEAEKLLQQQNIDLEAQYEEYMQLNEVLRQTNFDLELAKEKAEESDRLKTSFLQNISHEIRTPLNGIIGFSNLLNEENLTSDEIIEFSSLIQQSGKRLIEIVNNVLEISKIETGQMKVAFNPFSINEMLTDLNNFFLPVARAKNLNLNYSLSVDDEASIIHSDNAIIHQILVNLINNAVKFTFSGNVEFGYEIKANMVEFYVKDTGIGIAEELHNKIFERFVQAEQSLSRAYEGAGLGLAISKGLIELLGGEIWLKSELNIGSAFYFTIPYTNSNSLSNVHITKAEIIQTTNKIKILIAEDDLTSFKYLKKILNGNKYDILLAENGEQAIEIVKNNLDLDLILMDIRMPLMDGIEATKRIKSIKPDLPVIAQTAYAFSEEKNRILALGCDDYLSKPINKVELIQLINKFTNKRRL